MKALKSNNHDLLTSVAGLKREMDAKEEHIRDLLAERSGVEHHQAAPACPSDREARLQAEKERAEELARWLKTAEERQERLQVENQRLKQDAQKVDLQSPTSPTAMVSHFALVHQTVLDLSLSSWPLPVRPCSVVLQNLPFSLVCTSLACHLIVSRLTPINLKVTT